MCLCVDYLLDGDVFSHHVLDSTHLTHHTQLQPDDDASPHAPEARVVAVEIEQAKRRPNGTVEQPVRGRDHAHVDRRRPRLRLLSEPRVHHPGSAVLPLQAVALLPVLLFLLRQSQ